jgi:1-pyrroline-5-carboxylate dehydrogenase
MKCSCHHHHWQVQNLDEAMQIATHVNYGLTAGFYGSPAETDWFFENIEAGVTYANRPQGATTGAWPGFQPFGGWKGSGASGKKVADTIMCNSICTNRFVRL